MEQLVIRDIYGRELREGDEIFVGMKGPVLFRVVAIRPNMDPTKPPSLVYVELAARVMCTTQREAKTLEFIRVRTVDEAGPSPFATVPAPPGGQPS